MKIIIILFALVISGFASSPKEENESFARVKTLLDAIVPTVKDITEKSHGKKAEDELRARFDLETIDREMRLIDSLWTAAKNGIAKYGKPGPNTKTCWEGCVEEARKVPAMADKLHKEVTPLVPESDRVNVDEAFAKFHSVMAHCLEDLEAGKFP